MASDPTLGIGHPALDRFLATLQAENWGTKGNARFSVITFPNQSTAVVPPFLAPSVWHGMRDAS